MTHKELSQLYGLHREIELDQKQLQRVQALGSNQAQVRICEEKLAQKIEFAYAEYARLLTFLEQVDDTLVRSALHLRYVNGLPWLQVAYGIGGNTTEDGVKKMCYRYLQKTQG